MKMKKERENQCTLYSIFTAAVILGRREGIVSDNMVLGSESLEF